MVSKCALTGEKRGGPRFPGDLPTDSIELRQLLYQVILQYRQLYRSHFRQHFFQHCAKIARDAYRKAFGEDCILEAEQQMGSETFAMTAALWPSAFTCLGMNSKELGTTAEHHNEYFDVAEDTLATAAAAGLLYATAFQQSGVDVSAHAYQGSIGDYYRSIEHSKADIFAK